MGVAKQAREEVGEKRGVLVHYWVLSLLLIGPLAAWSQAAETWDPWNNPYGICTHQTTPAALRVIKAAGIGWIRIDMHWSDLEPSERGQFAWGALDSVVQLAREHQLKIYATVGGRQPGRPIHRFSQIQVAARTMCPRRARGIG